MDKEKQDSDLSDKFKAAANSVAMLYKEGITQSKKSYQTGYEQALQDVWESLILEGASRETVPLSMIFEIIQQKHHLNSQLNSKMPVFADNSVITAPTLSAFQYPNTSLENLEHFNTEAFKRRWTTDNPEDPTGKRHRHKDMD